MSILVTLLRIISEKMENNDPKMRIICIETLMGWAVAPMTGQI